MSFPTLQVRPNEKNPKVLRAHEFLRQANQLLERGMITVDGRKNMAKMLSKMVSESRAIYTLDEKVAEAKKTEKMMGRLKSTHELAMAVMEDRFLTADRLRQVQEKKLEVQQLRFEIDNLRISVQSNEAESKREKEKYEDQLVQTDKAREDLETRSASVLKHLERSSDVENLRRMEEEKRRLELEVEVSRAEKQAWAEEIRTKKATLKAESKKSFKKTVIECAKLYKLNESLTPKLERSKKSVERLKDEEERRKASGSLDDTIPFDRSFVLALMERTDPVPPKEHTDHPVPVVKQVSQAAPPPEEMEQDPVPVQVANVQNDVEMADTEIVKDRQDTEQTDVIAETQIVENLEPEEEAMEEQLEEEQESDRSMDVIEQEVEEEVEEQNNMNVTVVAPEVQNPQESGEQDGNQSPENRVPSENSVSKENFSFNYFDNTSNRQSPTGAQNVGDTQDSGMNFFNFGTTADDDDANNGSGFDFLASGSGTDGNAGGSNSDPFGFAMTSGGNGGAGDSSFNFNFDDKSSDNDGAGGNDFFNF